MEYGAFGGQLQRRRLRFLADVAGARRTIVLGEGDGRFLVQLVGQNRQAGTAGWTIDYVDLSGRMLDLARSRAGTENVAYLLADARTLPLPEAGYDLIVTHFFLDCLEQAEASRLVERMAAAARPDARWLISEFRVPGSGWSAGPARWLVAFLYLFFRATTGLRTARLVDHHPLLARQGFRLKRSESAWFGLLASELWVRVY
jgi:ubiquinone/menaquinone biosynthesis C-methylase UbiE